MTEFYPQPERPDWQLREEAVARACEVVGSGYQLGTVTVLYDSDDAAYGDVWCRATCSVCPAELMMRVSHALHLRQLALDTARTQCSRFGHQQDYDALAAESMPDYQEEGDL